MAGKRVWWEFGGEGLGSLRNVAFLLEFSFPLEHARLRYSGGKGVSEECSVKRIIVAKPENK